MKLHRRDLLLQAAAGASALLATPSVLAQAWPDKSIHLIVPFPPGGLIDNMARLLGTQLTRELGQTIVVDNKPGAGGNIGAAEVARAQPDGYTLLMASPALTIGPAVYKTLPYKPDSLGPVALLGRVPNVLLVNPSSSLKSIKDIVAKAKAQPGQLNYASNGNGTSLHLSAELFKRLTGTSITHIPYRGAAAAIVALLSNEVDLMFDNLPSAISQVQAGKLTALAVTTPERSPALPGVPTMAEAGLPGFEVSAWFGVVAPTGVPTAVTQQISAALEKALKQPEVTAAMKVQGATPAFMNSAGMASFMDKDAKQWKQVADFAKIRLD